MPGLCAHANAPDHKQYLKKEVLWSAFRVFDKDGDGKITKQELGAILKEQADGEAQVKDRACQREREMKMIKSGNPGHGLGSRLGWRWRDFIR